MNGAPPSSPIHKILTLADYLARREFPDSIARNCYYLDVHTAAGETTECAVLEVETGVDVIQIDTTELRRQLRESGAVLDKDDFLD